MPSMRWLANQTLMGSTTIEEMTTVTVKDLQPKYQDDDRVQIHQSVQTLPALPSYRGIIVETVPSYAEQRVGYNVQIDGDPRPARRWFFYEEQLTLVQN
jgi:hypothetical protein